MNVDEILKELKQIKSTNCFFNPYSYRKQASIQYNNLSNYFIHFKAQKNTILLVGEAPGYKGCKLTGIPFSSEKLIRQGIIQKHLQIDENLFLVQAKEKYQSEATATIFWETIINNNLTPMAWNIFPFHPHKINNVNSNRKPNKTELDFGVEILQQIITTFKPIKVIAVGKVAENKMLESDINCLAVPHPSYGKKKAFQSELIKLI